MSSTRGTSKKILEARAVLPDVRNDMIWYNQQGHVDRFLICGESMSTFWCVFMRLVSVEDSNWV